LIHLPLLVLNPLALAFCAVGMISAATTVTKPSADIRARIITVGLVSIDVIAEAAKNLKNWMVKI
jgi:hypothetical protein